MDKKFINESHRRVIEAIENAGLKIKEPIMLTADQTSKKWSVSMAFVSTGVHIPKSDIDVDEIENTTNTSYGGKIIVNNVWLYKG